MFTGQEQYFFEGVVIVYHCTNSIVWFGAMMPNFLKVCQKVSSALFSKRLKQNWPQLFTLLYHVDHHEIHIFIISWWFSSQFPGYITNQFNDQLPDGLVAQLVRELHGYHRWSSLLLYLHPAVLIHEFHLFIFSCHLVFQILLCLTTLIWKIMINLLWGLVGSLVKSWLLRRL